MNCDDFIDGGLNLEDMLRASKMLEEAGIDGIEMSGGTGDAASEYTAVRRGKAPSEDRQVYYLEEARQFRQRVNVPLILVGGIRSYGVADRLVAEGVTDFISLCRPLIREPGLVARWKSGDTTMSPCGSCNLCFGPIRRAEGLFCAYQQRVREKEQREMNE